MKVLVIGGSGAIGAALLKRLATQPGITELFATYRHHPPAVSAHSPRVHWQSLDLLDGAAIESLMASFDQLDWIVNCSGMLHDGNRQPEKALEQVAMDHFQRSMQLHCGANLLLAQAAVGPLRASSSPRLVMLSARVGSIEDNRLGGWYSYRCSKAALNMAAKTLAIEWRRRLPKASVAVYHPGTTDSDLSRPFQRQVPVGGLLTPAESAAHLLACVQRLTPTNSGRFWAWDGREIAW